MDRLVTESLLDRFARELLQQEKSPSTVAKYLRDVRAFQRFAAGGRVDKDLVLRYKRQLQQGYATASANSMLVALGCFFHFLGWEDCRVRRFKGQRRVFRARARELSREEYLRLVAVDDLDLLHLALFDHPFDGSPVAGHGRVVDIPEDVVADNERADQTVEPQHRRSRHVHIHLIIVLALICHI